MSWYLNASGIILNASGLVQKRVRSGSPDAFRYHHIASGLPPRSTLGTNPLNISKIAHDIFLCRHPGAGGVSRPKRKEKLENFRAGAFDSFADIVIGGKRYVVS